LLEASELVKKYHGLEIETRALDRVHIQVKPEEFIAVMGPSGCGKSTLLHILGLLDRPDSGNYLFNGQPAFPAPDKAREKLIRQGIGFVFQKFNLVDDLSIFDNVQLPLFYQNLSFRQRKIRVNEVLDEMGIGHRATHKPQQLSGGQQQRAAIARALVAQPLLILADEPTGNLDSENGHQVMEIFSKMNRAGKTIIMVTHSERDAAYAHKIIKMQDGRFQV
jgi:putative ABC transport system ATP-binding protein